MKRKLLIAGIDPGTTTAYALLDSYGKIIAKRASKDLEINSLIKEITEYGEVLAAGTDKRNCPAMVERFATKVGAKLIIPEEDLLVKEKGELIAGFSAGNVHENDALASAIFAFRGINPVIRKVRKYLRENGKEELFEEVMKTVLGRKINIKKSVELIERKDEIKILEIKEEKAENKKEANDSGWKVAKLEKENKLIRKYNKKLKAEIKRLLKYRTLARKNDDILQNKISGLLENKEKNVRTAYSRVSEKQREIEKLKKEAEMLKGALMDSSGKIIAKKLKTLDFHEVEEKIKKLRIKKDDILLVEDANIYSESAIMLLSGISTVIFKKQPSRKTMEELNFIFVDSKKLNLEEYDSFAAIGRKELENAKIEQNILSRVIEGYREERKRMVLR